MSRGFVLAALLSVLAAPVALAAPLPAPLPAPPPAPAPAQQQQPPAAVPDHSVSGIVKFVDRTRLVITRPGKIPLEMTFTVNPSTQKEGAIAVGAKVQVRYRVDVHSAVATAILVTPHAVPAKHTGQ